MGEPRRLSFVTLGYHLVFRAEDHRVLAPDVRSLRAVARVLLRVGVPRGLVAFRAVDTHIHALVLGSRADAGVLARHVGSTLHRALSLPCSLLPARPHPILDQLHLDRSVAYVHRQQRRHGAFLDPFEEASSLSDLLALRALPESTTLRTRLRAALPRLPIPTLTASPDGFDWADLADAAASSLLLPSLAGRSAAVTRARRAAVELARPLLAPHRLARLLAIDPRTVRALARSPREPELAHCVGRQLLHRQRVRRELHAGVGAQGMSDAFGGATATP